MAIKSTSASLSLTTTQVTITGFINYANGYLDTQSNTVKALGSATWSSLSGKSWRDYTNYIQTFETIKWTAPLLDLGAVQYFTLNIEADYQGSLYYIIHVSESGEFTGEETEYCVENGNYNVSGFYGRYAYVTAIIQGSELRDIKITADTTVKEYIIPNVNSSTLDGSSSNRIIDLPVEVSLIKDIHIQVKAATSYAVNLYVSDTPNSEILIPVVKSKSLTAPSFALYGIDNDARDGIVDISIKALPRQVMYGGNLVVLS